MRTAILKPFSLLALTLLFATPAAHAQDLDFSWLSCFVQPNTKSASVTLTPSMTENIKIGFGSQYDVDAKCHFYIVEYTVPANAGTNLPQGSPYWTTHKKFSFDSLTNEIMDTQAKCTSYLQQTVIFSRNPNGNSPNPQWGIAASGQLVGKWQNNKCRFQVAPNSEDFRAQILGAPPSGTATYRVASRVYTGPSSNRVARQVCVGFKFADIQDVPRGSCAVPE